ncbi:conserved hypothetical protein [Candidatus Terasakiella magnetica]|nr:conserved hypothetical protein [Candidatus Terasakiella magnetica]
MGMAGQSGSGGFLRVMRAKALGIVQALLFALTLQAALPTLAAADSIMMAGDAAWAADLNASLCHDGSSDTPAGQPGQSGSAGTSKHCIFCLPLAGEHAALKSDLILVLPSVHPLQIAVLHEDGAPPAHRQIFANPRAPPASPIPV